MNKVAVVILNWNGKELLEKLLPILIQNTPTEIDIILGDNASTDDSIAFVNSNFPRIQILENERNLGFAEGYNKILERVDTDYFILLNSDVEVSPHWVEPIIKYLDENPEVAVAQPKILSYFDRESFEYAGAAGGYMDSLGYFFCRGRIFDSLEKDLGQYDNTLPVFWASGAAFFIRSKQFKDIGGFDPSLFAHMEEIDLCWRLQRQGHKIAFIPSSTVYHMGGQTLHLQNAQKTYLNFRNNLIILYKNLDADCRYKILIKRFFMDFLAWLHFLFLFKWNHSWAISRAHWDFLKLKKNYMCQGSKKDHKALDYTHNLPGYYPRSLVWEYYFLKKNKFSELFKASS